MDFKKIKTLTQVSLQTKKMKFQKDTIARISAVYFAVRHDMVIAGLADGRLLVFVPKGGADSKSLFDGKDYDVREYSIDGQHRGEIKCVLYQKIKGMFFFITGSADRTIKIWETDPKNKKIVQTLTGHNGTVFDMKYNHETDTLYTCANDKTFRIWKLDPGRELMLYPFFICTNPLTQAPFRKASLDKTGVNFLTLDIQKGELPLIYAGDSEGSVHVIKIDESKREKDEYEISKSLYGFHRLSIIAILVVPIESFCFTCSYDQKIHGFETVSGKPFYSLKNQSKALFTSLAWDDKHQELIAADDSGAIYFINVHQENVFSKFQLFDFKILRIHYIESLSQLLVCGENSVEVLKIKQGQSIQNYLGSHTGPVLKLIEMDPKKMTKLPTKETPKLISTSYDNTIRMWEIADNVVVHYAENDPKTEICCMEFLSKCNLIATGIDDGNIKLWLIEIASFTYLQTKTGEKPHKNSVCALTSAIIDGTEVLFSSGYDGKILTWELTEKKTSNLASNVMGPSITPQLKNQGFYPDPYQTKDEIGKEILCLLFRQTTDRADKDNKRQIIAAGNSGVVYLINFENYEKRSALRGHTDSVNCLALEENLLFSGSDDKSIIVWEIDQEYMIARIDASKVPIRDLLMIKETGHLVACGKDGKIKVWDYTSQVVIREFEKKEDLRCLAYCYSQKLLFVGTDEGNIYSFNIKDLLNSPLVRKDFEQKMEESLSDLGIKDGPLDYASSLEESKIDN